MLSTLLCKSLQREVERCMLCVVRNNTRDCPQSSLVLLGQALGAARLAELDTGVGVGIGIGISQCLYHDCNLSPPIIPTISANIHSDTSLSACFLDTARSGPLQSAYICLPIVSSTDTQAILTVPFVLATLLNNNVYYRGEERYPACCGHVLLPSRLYRRGFLSNWRRLQSEAVVRHYRHHLFRAQGIVWWHLVS
jgi:hypothetical protein